MINENVKKDKPEEPGNGHGGHNQVSVKVRYQSDTVSIRINVNASVSALLEKSINETENGSIPVERFQLKLGGTVLDPKRKVEDYAITEGTLLVLCLLAGGGGNN